MSAPATVGRYRIAREIGRGGMGVVYAGHDPELDRPVAIKLIHLPAEAGSELRDEYERRFRREAKAAARVRHPGVVAIHDVGRHGGDLFLVMELVEGTSLSARLTRGEYPERSETLEIAAQTAEALAAAHAVGLVHRDVKPGNLLLDRSGRVMVTDFGVARSLDEASDLTRTGVVVGSPAYMAPEQLQGQPVDGRADLFSLGVVLYEMLLRRRPFPAQSMTTLLYQILHQDPLADPEITRALDPATEALLRRFLAKEPGRRMPDAATAAAALRDLAAGPQAARTAAMPASPPPPPTAAVPPPPPPLAATPETVPAPAAAAPAPAGVRRGVLWTAIAALAVAAIALAWWATAGRPDRPQAGGTPAPWSPAAEEPLAAAAPAEPTAEPLEIVPLRTPEEAPPEEESAPAALPPPAAAPPRPAPRELAAPAGSPVVSSPAAAPVPPKVAPPPRVPEILPVLIASTRRTADLEIDPDDAVVFVDGVRRGTVEELDAELTFSSPGRHRLRFERPGRRTVHVEVQVGPTAPVEVVEIELELPEP